ncbi:MAG: acyl-CoA thioesterase, partial [Gaiellaceae bacterium]
QAEYLAVLRFEDEITVDLAVDLIGRTSVEYTWEIRRGEQLCVRGRHTVVHVDEEGRPAPLPETLRRALAG